MKHFFFDLIGVAFRLNFADDVILESDDHGALSDEWGWR